MSESVIELELSCHDRLLDDLNKAEAACHKAIRVLQDVKKKLEKHQRRVRISKTAAAVGGMVGTALLFTPAFSFGLVLAGGSTLTLIGAEIGDAIVTDKEKKKIIDLVEAVKERTAEVDKHRENIANLAQELQTAGFPEKKANDTAWYWYASKGGKGAVKAKKFVFDVKNAVKCIRASQACKGAIALMHLPAKCAGSSPARNILLKCITVAGKKIVGTAVSIAFDMWTLVQAWRNQNVTLVQAEETLKKLEELKDDYSQVISNLTSTE